MATEQTKHALSAAQVVAQVRDRAKWEFIDRDDACDAIAWASVAGEHGILLGPPGTGKSSLIRFFASYLGLGFFRKLLNPDTTRDELVGPIDPIALAQGKWSRKWSGLATNHFVFLDEVGKASSQVLNMTLDSMEERLVSSGSGDQEIPLHTLWGATNETLSEDLAAAWDRFTLRIVVRRLSSSAHLASLLTRKSGSSSRIVSTSLGNDDLQAMRSECARMASSPSDEVVGCVVRMWSKISKVTSESVSDRRWEKILRLAAGHALLDGRSEISCEDLIVAKHILWEKLDDISRIHTFVHNEVNEEEADLQAKKLLTQDLQTSLTKATNLQERAIVTVRAERLLREIATRTSPTWAEVRETLSRIKETSLG